MANEKTLPNPDDPRAEKDHAASAVVLYLPFTALPPEPGEMLRRLAEASGIQAGDMRYRIVGRGVSRLTPSLPPAKQKSLVAEMQSIGIPAAIVSRNRLHRRLKLPVARSVEINSNSLIFFDRNQHPVFNIDKNIDLLLIAADLTGGKQKKTLYLPDFEHQGAVNSSNRSFGDALQKISIGSPAAVFCRVGAEDVEGVLVAHSSFHYRSMNGYMQISAAANFRALIEMSMKRAKTCIADHGFATTTLARINYGPESTHREILASLGRYTNYMLAAAEAGIIRPGAPMSADYSCKPLSGHAAGIIAGADAARLPQKGSGRSSGESADGRPGPSRSPSDGEPHAKRPKPPPPVRHRGMIARILSTPWEALYALIFLSGPVVSALVQTGDQTYTKFWEAATGIVLAGAGAVLFPYGLMNLHYKRMVENTPTSKIRSMAMGMVEITGRARQYYDLKTTYSGTRCIYFRCRYYRKKRIGWSGRRSLYASGRGEGETWALESETASGRLPFYLEDDTGRVLVRPEGALFHISRYTQQFSGAFGVAATFGAGHSGTRVYEDLIADGAGVYVLGKARPEKTGDPVSARIRKELAALKKDKNRLMAYDANNNNRVDPDEWETARRDVENRVYAEMLAEGSPTERSVIGRPPYGTLPFIIADSEEGIIRKLQFRVWLFLAGGLLFLGAGFQMLLQILL